MASNRKDVCVIGIGQFGSSVVEELANLRRYVLALDIDEKRVEKVARIANQVAIIDGADIEGLKELGIQHFETIIVGTSNNIDIVASLLEMGVKHIIAKASSKRHERVLKQIGVDVIIKPDYEAGRRTALYATNSIFIRYSKKIEEIGGGFAMTSLVLKNPNWTGKPLEALNFRKLKVNVVFAKRKSQLFLPTGMLKLAIDDTITIIGEFNAITLALELLGTENGKNPL